MEKYKIVIEYKGDAFFGWQSQKNGETVQDTIENALTQLTKEISIVEGAGRTDAGVHALGQVGHFILDKEWNPNKLLEGINFYLRNKGVSILSVEKVPNEFHARFSARLRTYRYDILNRRASSPLLRSKAWHVKTPLNLDSMKEGATFLLGTHDFSSFRAIKCQSKRPIRTLANIRFLKEGDILSTFFESKSFLHNQVRIMIGTLKLVGEGKWNPLRIKTILEEKNRAEAGPTAPPYGLYLTRIDY